MDPRQVFELLRHPSQTELLLADPKQTATALLGIKYSVTESRDALELERALKSLCALLTQSAAVWGGIDQDFVDHVIEIAADRGRPSSVVCPALSVIGVLALETKRRQYTSNEQQVDLEDSIKREPRFFPAVIGRLESMHAETVLVTIQTVNAILVGLHIGTASNASGSTIYESLREADIFRFVSFLTEGPSDVLSKCRAPLCDLQDLLKVCIARSASTAVDLDLAFHRMTMDMAENYVASYVGYKPDSDGAEADWARAGVPQTVRPQSLINDSGARWAGLLDLNDFLSEEKLDFKKNYLEQSAFAKPSARFPLVKASLAVTSILVDLFDLRSIALSDALVSGTAESLQPPDYVPKVEGAAATDAAATIAPTSTSASRMSTMTPSTSMSSVRAPDSPQMSVERFMSSLDNLRPLFFDWPALHSAGVSNFMRIWQVSTAESGDFDNIEEVVSILFQRATKPYLTSSAASGLDKVVASLNTMPYEELRGAQLRAIETKFNEKWGDEIHSLQKTYAKEALDFIREQRVRLLLLGDWFYVDDPTVSFGSSPSSAGQQRGATYSGNPASSPSISSGNVSAANTSRSQKRLYFISLSPNRKSLVYGQFTQRSTEAPSPELLNRSIDLTAVSKVTVVPITRATPNHAKGLKRVSLASRTNYTKIALVGNSGSRDGASLTFFSDTPEKASTWGDGLLMLKNRSHQSQETKSFIEMLADTRLRVQMLSLTPADLDHENMGRKPEVDLQELAAISTDFYYTERVV